MNPYPITSERVAVGRGYSVGFSFDGSRLDCQWSPRMPYGRHGRSVLSAYQAARNAFLGKVASFTGQNVAVVDLSAAGGADG